MTFPLPSSRSTLKARISPSRPSRSSSLVFRFQMRLDRAWSSWNLEKMGGHIRNAEWKDAVKLRIFYYLLMIKKLPVDFNLYSLPPLPQDDWLLVWILKTNASFQIKASSLTISYSVFAASERMKSMMNEWWGNKGIKLKQFVCIIMQQRISNMKRRLKKTSWKNQKRYDFPKWVLWFWLCVN